MGNNIRLAAINDEISENLTKTISFFNENNIRFIELRTLNNKNLIHYSEEDIKNVSKELESNHINVSAFASPLFKWYLNDYPLPNVANQHFNFTPSLSLKDKKKYIHKAIKIAKLLRTNNVRVFSSLRTGNEQYSLLEDNLFQFALAEAKDWGINLLLENEPPCYIYTLSDLKMVTDCCPNENFGIWLDIANIIETSQTVTKNDLKLLKAHIKYFHLKDFDTNNSYVPLGQGVINYKSIINDIMNVIDLETIYFSIETHVHSDPKKALLNSLSFVTKLINSSKP
ncbi:MAG: sugar phosphate isomerase/epimerase [Deltaproteobacteria bacterium]|nr:sugar phosphate isomerase/epimerase [Deltaproteobacteria bacterium]